MEGNKLIAEFIGLELEETLEGLFVYARKEQNPIKLNDIKTEFYEVNELQFHTSWDWLMPVIAKIVEDYGSGWSFEEGYDLDVRYKAVVNFIKEYNK